MHLLLIYFNQQTNKLTISLHLVVKNTFLLHNTEFKFNKLYKYFLNKIIKIHYLHKQFTF